MFHASFYTLSVVCSPLKCVIQSLAGGHVICGHVMSAVNAVQPANCCWANAACSARRLTFRKISDIRANQCQILTLKRTKFRLHSRPSRGSLQRSPEPLAVFKGPTSKGSWGEGREGCPPIVECGPANIREAGQVCEVGLRCPDSLVFSLQ